MIDILTNRQKMKIIECIKYNLCQRQYQYLHRNMDMLIEKNKENSIGFYYNNDFYFKSNPPGGKYKKWMMKEHLQYELVPVFKQLIATKKQLRKTQITIILYLQDVLTLCKNICEIYLIVPDSIKPIIKDNYSIIGLLSEDDKRILLDMKNKLLKDHPNIEIIIKKNAFKELFFK